MRLRDTIILFVCIILAAVLLTTAGMRLDYINSQRQKMKLISNQPLENAPPSLAFATVAMGAFRGLVVDVLWLRADTLKEQGQFFDAKQLAEWITTLQPRFASVWIFHSWNMAYNISVAIPASQPQERWRWVKNGYELLRDQGIPLNPKSMPLYHQLAMTFQHKIGGVTDEVHKYYKLQLALQMEPLLGPADNQYFQALVEAPTNWNKISSDPNVVSFIAALKSADKVFADDDKFVGNYLSLRQNPARFNSRAFETIDNFRGTRALEQFDIFAKAYHLRNTWKLEPVLMQQLNKTYGPVEYNDPNKHLPLDWRHPLTHAIYWAVKGLQVASKAQWSVDQANVNRIVNQSLQNLFRNGKIFIYNLPARTPVDSSTEPQAGQGKKLFTRQDLRMFDVYNKSVLAVIEEYKDLKESTYNSMQIGHRNMVENAVLLFYQSGHIPKAQKLLNQLNRLYPRVQFQIPLAVFARNKLREEFEEIGLTDAKEMVQAMLRESYFRYAVRDDDEAAGREKMAKEVHDYYQSHYRDENRIDLPDFRLLRYFALLDFFNDPRYPIDLRRSLISRIKIEKPDLAEKFKQQELQLLKQSQQPK